MTCHIAKSIIMVLRHWTQKIILESLPLICKIWSELDDFELLSKPNIDNPLIVEGRKLKGQWTETNPSPHGKGADGPCRKANHGFHDRDSATHSTRTIQDGLAFWGNGQLSACWLAQSREKKGGWTSMHLDRGDGYFRSVPTGIHSSQHPLLELLIFRA